MTREGRTLRALPIDLALVGLLFAFKLAIDACVLRGGFSHVSDDDYARTVIAEQFAHAPRLDPSGTSWLPLPFWIAGTAMTFVGRSLGAARGIAVVLGALGAVTPFAAMRAVRVPRPSALAATLVAMALPWGAWLGAATVPDGWTAALIAAGVIAMPNERARPWCALALFGASLARYEAWAACGAFAIFCLLRAAKGRGSRADLACAALALAGPALWMLWNAHAHGSPFHFIARVTAFRRAIGAADVPLSDKLLGYPRALLADAPEAVALGVCGGVGLVVSPTLRHRWRWPAVAAFAVLAFLVVGDLGDGAPTHHPARALESVVWIAVGMGIDALASTLHALPALAPRVAGSVPAGLVAAAWVATLPTRWGAAPGGTDSERRDAQIARGIELRERGTSSAEITPCEFEHFALLAAWGQPERAQIHPRTREPLTASCPRVTTR